MTVQVNVSLEKDDAAILDQMANDAGYDNRSAFVRWLIRREWLRKSQTANRKNKLPDSLHDTSIPSESIQAESQP
jgi:metal-responsive CopG/Arc/MetJ family transcriptional regulator